MDKCKSCNLQRTVEGHDGCLGTLIGVMNACCGHGNSYDSYVQFLDGNTVQGDDAKVILDILKRTEPDSDINWIDSVVSERDELREQVVLLSTYHT